MLKKKNILSLFAFLLFAWATFGQCPTLQNGNPGNPNKTVIFYNANGQIVATCQCQLAGNNLKCGDCKPDEEDYFYYELSVQSSTETCYSSFALGVSLSDYTTKQTDKGIELTWTTVMEENNAYFYWQKSPDGNVEWNLDHVEGKGTTSEQSMYRYVDENPIREWAYYRLVQVDFDGKETKYPWVYVFKEDLRTDALRLIPNPSKGEFSFLLPYRWDKAEINIINLTGQIVYRQTVNAMDETIYSNLGPGRYTVQVKSDQGCSYGTLLIVQNNGYPN